MKCYLGHAFALAVAILSAPLEAQDMIGFDRTSFGKVVLSRTESAGIDPDDRIFELAVDSYNNESIQNYSADSVFSRLGRSVGRLDILTDTGIFPCTAFIVDKKHILTNYHCVPGILDNEQAKATRIDGVQFVAGYIQQGVDEGTNRYTVSPTPVEADKELDYALLEVIGDPSAKYGVLALSARQPNDNDPFWIIGHPMGEAQRVSREKCKANSPSLSNNELLHTCDTLPGNSGSPVIDASMQTVIALHHAGSKKASVNFAIPMSLILAKSNYLVAAVGDVLSGPTTGISTASPTPVVSGLAESATDICDSLYAEAKVHDACFAYRAYANSCASHPYVGFASAYVDENCSVQNGTEVVTRPAPVVEATPTPEVDNSTTGEGLRICNETEYVQSVSVGYLGEDEKWTSEGWWNLEQSKCATVVAGALQKQQYYYRAEVDGGPFEGGGFSFCTSPDVYTIVGDTECEARGYETEKFAKIDTGPTATSFVFTLGASEALPAVENTPTPAQGNTPGEGLRICNETASVQAVSVGYQGEDEKWTSEGWWNLDQNQCTTVLSGALKKRYYYYRAEVDGGPFDGGGYRFCTSPKEYTIAGDTECEARGYEREDFAEIDTGPTAKSFVFTLVDAN